MNHLSLFTGAGGGELGAILNGWHTVGYVEWDDYCQRVLAQRIKDGILPEAPIFGDLRAFISEGYAEAYQGMVDVVSGGFPCQPFSVAGKRKGAGDDRNMWPATLEVIRLVRPKFALLENVPGLNTVRKSYLGRILGGLSEAGFDARWCVLGADDCGAPHRRKRLWILAHAEGIGMEGVRPSGEQEREAHEGQAISLCPGGHSWWATEPSVGRVAHGVAHRVDRLKAIGNGQVPAVVRTVWSLLRQHESVSGCREEL